MSESGHWYDKDGNPHHWVAKKDGSGNRATTIADARKHGWLPGVSSIIKCAAAPQLERWKMLQACTAVLTSPRRDGEELDAFMNRVLFEDKEAEQEAKAAADRGTAIHDAIALALQGKPVENQWQPYVDHALSVINAWGKVVWSERVLVGKGYAGRADVCVAEAERDGLLLLDFKSAKKLPEKGSWDSHRLQTSAYATAVKSSAASSNEFERPLMTGNLYLSTTDPDDTVLFVQSQNEWRETFRCGFLPLLKYWQWLNKYTPWTPTP